MLFRLTIAALLLVAVSACHADETVASYGAGGQEFFLSEINAKAFDARASISFSETGRISGQAPCNRYFAQMSAPYPWFKAEAIGATKMACAALDQEAVFFDALGRMSLSEISGDTLILSNEAGESMVFKANGD